MSKLKKTAYFYMAMSGLISLAILILMTLFQDYSFLEELATPVKIIELGLYSFSFILTLVSFFFPHRQVLYYIVLASLILWDIIKGEEITAILLFLILVALLIAHGFFYKNTIYRVIAILLTWIAMFVAIVLLNNTDLIRIMYFCIISFFSLGAFTTITILLKPVIQDKVTDKITDSNDIYKSRIKKLTHRQTVCINYILNGDLQYKEIANDLNISISTVKKEVATIYKLFGVTSKIELRALFDDNDLRVYLPDNTI